MLVYTPIQRRWLSERSKCISTANQVLITSYGPRSTQASSLLKFVGYKNNSAFRGKFKSSSIEVFYPSCGGLEGATNLSRSIPSAIRVAAAMKVSMKERKSCFLVLATLRDTSLSSLASLQWTRTKGRATSAPHLAEDFFHSCTRLGTSQCRCATLRPSVLQGNRPLQQRKTRGGARS